MLIVDFFIWKVFTKKTEFIYKKGKVHIIVIILNHDFILLLCEEELVYSLKIDI